MSTPNILAIPKDLLQDEPSKDEFIKFRIEIHDTGVGIKEENLGKLFMDFGRLDEHTKMNAQGTGLGLSICKRMIEQMGGTVSVKSTEGVGTIFSIDISTKSVKEVVKEPEMPFGMLRRQSSEKQMLPKIIKDFDLTCVVANDDSFSLMAMTIQL